jgi:FMN phosphatase YigB (HAD superfamily)
LTDIRLAKVRAAIESGGVGVLSVDIFDTLLWRRVPEPADLFLVLGHGLAAEGHLAPGTSAVAFAELRRAAELRAREKAQAASGYREVTLPDVYGQLPASLFAAGFGRAAQIEAELTCERRLVVADDAIVGLIATARAAGARVILVSDTYFKADQIRELLKAAGCGDLAIDRLYVSCEAGRPKYRDLFDIILNDMDVAPSEIFHIGDSLEADIAPCAARGITAAHYGKTALPARVHDLEFPRDTASRAAALSGHGDFGLTGLRSRLRHRPPAGTAKDMAAYWQIGAGTLAPIFAGFARWIVGHAAAVGAKRVLGIMREGRFLGRLVEATARDLGVTMTAEEVWLSRRAVIGAALYADDLSMLTDLIVVAAGETVDEVLASLGLSAAEVTAVIPGFDMQRPGALGTLGQAITAVPYLKDKVLAQSARNRRNLLKGLKRHMDIRADDTILLMDLGYAGTIQTLLARILAREGARVRLRGLYFVLNDLALANRGGGTDMDSYLGDGGFNSRIGRLLTRTPDVLEHACMCREGSLDRYDETGAPVLLANQRSDTQLTQMDVLQTGILAGVSAINRLLGPLDATPHDTPALKAQIARILECILLRPTPEETGTIGLWQHEANLDVTDRRRLIDLAFDPAALEYRGLAALADVGRQHTYWPAAAFTHVSPFLAQAFAAGVEGNDHALLTSGPLLGSLTVTPDFGAGFDEMHSLSAPLAVNAFGRSEIQLPLKDFGADTLTRVKLTWPAAQAVIAIIPPVFTCRGERETRGLAVNGLEWFGSKEMFQGVQMTSGDDAGAVIDLGRPPPFAHAIDMTLRFKYLRLAPIFGMQ